MALEKNTRVFARIATESRQDDIKHDDILQNLFCQQEDMKRVLFSWIHHKICSHPLYVLYWSKPGLTIYYTKSITGATGTDCCPNAGGKQMFYY